MHDRELPRLLDQILDLLSAAETPASIDIEQALVEWDAPQRKLSCWLTICPLRVEGRFCGKLASRHPTRIVGQIQTEVGDRQPLLLTIDYGRM